MRLQLIILCCICPSIILADTNNITAYDAKTNIVASLNNILSSRQRERNYNKSLGDLAVQIRAAYKITDLDTRAATIAKLRMAETKLVVLQRHEMDSIYLRQDQIHASVKKFSLDEWFIDTKLNMKFVSKMNALE